MRGVLSDSCAVMIVPPRSDPGADQPAPAARFTEGGCPAARRPTAGPDFWQREGMTTTDVPWEDGAWLNPPEAVRIDAATSGDQQRGQRPVADDVIRLRQGHAHALLVDLPDGMAVEVAFVVELAEQFDQAGVLVRAGERHWVKAGVEVSDGAPQLGAVATRGVSDWSVAPVPGWAGGRGDRPGEP